MPISEHSREDIVLQMQYNAVRNQWGVDYVWSKTGERAFKHIAASGKHLQTALNDMLQQCIEKLPNKLNWADDPRIVK